MSNTNIKVMEGGLTALSAFNNTLVSGEKINAVVPVDDTGTPIHLLDPDVSNRHTVCAEIIPTILTNGGNIFSFRNPTADKVIKIHRIEAIQLFTGTAAASKSAFRFKRYTGCTAVSGSMAAVTASKRDNTNIPSIAEIRTSASGITLTGGNVESDGFAQIMSLNQLTVIQEKDWDFSNYPINLRLNEGICLQNSGANVAGTVISLSIQYSEV